MIHNILREFNEIVLRLWLPHHFIVDQIFSVYMPFSKYSKDNHPYYLFGQGPFCLDTNTNTFTDNYYNCIFHRISWLKACWVNIGIMIFLHRVNGIYEPFETNPINCRRCTASIPYWNAFLQINCRYWPHCWTYASVSYLWIMVVFYCPT